MAKTTSIDLRREAVAELGKALREAIVALVATEVSNDDILAAASTAREISELLARASRPLKKLASIDDLQSGVRFFSPIVGPGNPMAPPLQFRSLNDGIVSHATLDRRFEGPAGFVHGGITALIFDEALGRAAAHALRWGMTASLTVDYRQAVPLDTPLEITARVTSKDGRKTTLEGVIALASAPGIHLASAHGLFIQPRQEKHAEYFGDLVDSNGEPASGNFGVFE